MAKGAKMYKLIFCGRKRDDITQEEFFRYWKEEHAELFKTVADKIGAVKYIQSHARLPELNQAFVEMRGFQEPYDGVTELWFDGEPDFESNADILAMLAEDEEKFINISRSSVFLTQEHLVLDETESSETPLMF